MDIRFVPPELRRLDETSVELCACTIWSDVRPVRGLAGLLDWRLSGRLSALLASGFVTGEAGEALLLPGKPHVPFEKTLIVGLGKRADFGEAVFRDAVQHFARQLTGLRVRRAVVELPGRAEGLVEPEQAITWMLESLGPTPDHDAWWLVEDAAAERRAEERVRTSHRTPSISDR
jgi:Cytosol aminopeptidase family, N-terminal domain